MHKEFIHLWRFVLLILQLRTIVSLGISKRELVDSIQVGVLQNPWKINGQPRPARSIDTNVMLDLQESSWSRLSEDDKEEHERVRRELNEDFLERMTLTPEEFIDDAVLWHNILRERHGSPPLELDYKLCFLAEQHAADLAEQSEYAGKLVLRHSKGLPMGEGESMGARNVGSRSDLMDLPGGYVVKNWYKEIRYHDWERNYYQKNSSHFTQLVWRATKNVGCGRAVSQNAILIVVCRYHPGGNYAVQAAFDSHVKPPLDGEPNSLPSREDFKTTPVT